MIDSRQRSKYFRTAKERVRKYVMEPAGFQKGKHLYVRAVDDQIHGIYFQPNRFGGSYFVNVAFHYQFLPGFLVGGFVSPTEFHVLDFLFMTRLDEVLGPRTPDNLPEWKYGNSAEESEYFLARNARNAIAALGAQGERWKNPKVLLNLVPPDLIVAELHEFEILKRRRQSDPSLPTDACKQPLYDVFGHVWSVDLFPFTYALACISLRAGQHGLARAYCNILGRVVRSRPDAALATQLAGQIKST